MEPGKLREAWTAIRSERPSAAQRDSAEHLGVTEAELVAAHCGETAVRLAPAWASLLFRMEQLGLLIGVTRTRDSVIEREGVYRRLEPRKEGLFVRDSGIDLCARLHAWRYGFAVTELTRRGVRQSLQFFDGAGASVHKAFLTHTSDRAAYDAVVDQFAHTDQRAAISVEPPARPRDVRPSPRDRGCHRLTTAGLLFALELAAARGVPLVLSVGNAGAVQRHSGVIQRVKTTSDWISVVDDALRLHVRSRALDSVWLIERTGPEGLVWRIVAFDHHGQLLIALRGTRTHGVRQFHRWWEIAQQLPRG